MLSSIDPVQGVEALTKATEGRSESLVVILVGLGLVAFVIWRWEVRQNKEDERQDKRDEFQRTKDLTDSEQLRLIAESNNKMAGILENLCETIKDVRDRQTKHGRVLLHTINAIHSINKGESDATHLQKAQFELRDE
jgi:uncharacterized protein HemX